MAAFISAIPFHAMPCHALPCLATHSLESSQMSRLDTARVLPQHRMMRTHTTSFPNCAFHSCCDSPK